ncbi:MAG: type II secretion system GspH family protein [Campylobacter sp.]|uniref:type II secretion system protein n=1 Tax=Campylobacter sp. TaxID=205 RepID=UPI002AA92E34|nr:type II secretion system protein [Campylobacter sp.]MCI7024325.1 type II secretion system GspH family protein [Campylobacter sp.]
MKKGFTMIELIFVIVILGILASVAIPRLAATREDAEISTTIANLRTLVSEASAYYVAHGTFSPGGNNATWNQVTNVPLSTPNAEVVGTGDTATAPTAHLQAGRENCIGVRLVNKNGNTPAHIVLTSVTPAPNANSVCAQVLASEPVAAYLRSTSGNGAGTVAVGSSTGIYRAAPQPENNNRGTETGAPTTNGVGVGG